MKKGKKVVSRLFALLAVVVLMSSCGGFKDFNKRKFRKKRYVEQKHSNKTTKAAVDEIPEFVDFTAEADFSKTNAGTNTIQSSKPVNKSKRHHIKLDEFKRDSRRTLMLKKRLEASNCDGQLERLEAKFNQDEYQFPIEEKVTQKERPADTLVLNVLLVLTLFGLFVYLVFKLMVQSARKEIAGR